MHIVVFVTAKDEQEAGKIAEGLVQNKLVACANIVSGIKSVFWWEGKVDRAQECLLILKSKKNFFSRIVKTVKSLHSYETPEIIALPIVEGYKGYLDWIDGSVAKS